MKFSILYTSLEGGRLERISGFTSLRSVIVAAVALAGIAERKDLFLHVKTGGVHDETLAVVPTKPEYLQQWPLTTLLETATKKLAVAKKQRAEAKVRWKFIQPWGSEGRERMYADEIARTAFFKNDFPAVKARLAELGLMEVAA